MSNNFKKKQQEERKKFKAWENPRSKDRYIRFGHDGLEEGHFKALSSNAKVVYMYMKDWAYGCKAFLEKENNGGRGEFEFSISFAKEVLHSSTQTASNAIHELEEEGFIERQNNSAKSRETSVWKFTDRWYTGKERKMV